MPDRSVIGWEPFSATGFLMSDERQLPELALRPAADEYR